MEQKFEGIFGEIVKRSGQVDKILLGDTLEIKPEEIAEEDAFSGVVFDENTDTSLEVEHLKRQLERVLGCNIGNVAVAAVLDSSDGDTRVEIFDECLGLDEEYFLSRWQKVGEKPSYVLWPKEMYDSQLLEDEEAEAPFRLVEGIWE